MRRLLAALLFTLATVAHAQAPWPTHSVKLVVPFPPGGSTDITARLLADKLSSTWGQPVVVENKAGAAGNIGAAAVAHAAPDGYTLILATTALSISPSVFQALTYDALADLAPVTLVSTLPNVLVVPPAMPAHTIDEFIARLRAHPGQLNFAAPGASSGQRMMFEQIKQLTGTDIVMVPYNGGAPALQALLAGQVQAMISNVVEAVPYVRSGKLRALAVTTARRSPMLPDVPTLAETVVPGLDTSVWQGLLAPAGTPAAVIDKVQHDVAQALALPEVHERLVALGMEVRPGTPQAFAEFLRKDIATWRRVAQGARLQPQ